MRAGQTITWDAENRVAGVSYGRQMTSFVYGPAGERVKVVVGSVTTVYVGDSYEKNLSTGVVTTYYTFGGRRVALRQGASTYWLHADHLGSTALVTDASGGKAGERRYYPWGALRSPQSGDVHTKRLYTGQLFDESTGLYYYGARYYDVVIGRFISPDTLVPDPANPQSLSRYSYVLNAPLLYTDPTGHRECGAACEGESYDAPDPAQPPPAPKIPRSPPGGDPAEPFDVGVEWLTGEGPRRHDFREGDPFTELLQEHSHIEETRAEVAERVAAGNYSPWHRHYNLGGIEGVPKYVQDYSNVLTFGNTGNLAVTFLGSYKLFYWVVSVDRDAGEAEVLFHVWNETTLASGTHPPILGYTEFWIKTVEPTVNSLVPTGPMSRVVQNFWWTETIRFK